MLITKTCNQDTFKPGLFATIRRAIFFRGRWALTKFVNVGVLFLLLLLIVFIIPNRASCKKPTPVVC